MPSRFYKPICGVLKTPCQQHSTAIPQSSQINTASEYCEEGCPVNTIRVSHHSPTLATVFGIFASFKVNPTLQLKWGARPVSPNHGGLQPMRSRHFWLQLPNIHPTKFFFPKGQLPDANLPLATRAGPSRKTTKPVGISTQPVIVYKALFAHSSFAFRIQEWA
jgi:hypothetical protein